MSATRFAIIRTSAILAAIVLSAAVAPATSHAQNIEACFAPKTGTVYRINTTGAPMQCSKGHAYFSWNAQGPKGDIGPQGPAGGIAGVQYVEGTPTLIVPNEGKSVVALCPVGKVAISGGFTSTGGNSLFGVTYSRPIIDLQGGLYGWSASVFNHGVSGYLVHAWVTCATRSS